MTLVLDLLGQWALVDTLRSAQSRFLVGPLRLTHPTRLIAKARKEQKR